MPPETTVASKSHLSHGVAEETIIGFSEEGRPLTVFTLPQAANDTLSAAPLKVLLLAGQHGDEPLPQQVLRQLLKNPEAVQRRWPGLTLALLPSLNPDGNAHKRRKNAAGIDLNRDHMLLESAEVRALHGFVRTWQPDVVIDLHTYPPRRQHLLDQGLIHVQDIFLDVPTHPNAPQTLPHALLDEVLTTLRARGLQAARYTLISPSGRVRHSTPDVRDARNGLALRYGCLSMLLEAFTPKTSAEKKHTLHAVREAITVILNSLERHQQALQLLPVASRQVVIGARYQTAPDLLTLNFAQAATGEITLVTLPGRYTPTLAPTRSVAPPHAYAIPRELIKLLMVLQRHGVALVEAGTAPYPVKRYLIEALKLSKRAERAPRTLSVRSEMLTAELGAYMLAPVTTTNANLLATFLEPEAKYALHRFPGLIPLDAGMAYPIMRLPHAQDSTSPQPDI